MISFNKRNMQSLTYSFCIVLLDQFSKLIALNRLNLEGSINIIPKLLNFTLVKNTGAAFSLFSNSTNLLTIISILASVLIITVILKFSPKSHWNSTGPIYLLGGTLGNGIDRFTKGYVIDFLELVPIDFPIFNIADISINIAIICFLIDILKTTNNSRINY